MVQLKEFDDPGYSGVVADLQILNEVRPEVELEETIEGNTTVYTVIGETFFQNLAVRNDAHDLLILRVDESTLTIASTEVDDTSGKLELNGDATFCTVGAGVVSAIKD